MSLTSGAWREKFRDHSRLRTSARGDDYRLDVGGEESTVRMILELTVGATPIGGRVVLKDGSVREFTGWLALVRALEEATAIGDRPSLPSDDTEARRARERSRDGN